MKRHRRTPSIRVDEWLLPAFVLVVFLIGGASRADVLSTVVLRPLAVAFTGLALMCAPMTTFLRHRFILMILVGSAVLISIHLTPLPHALWAALPGRDLLTAADALSGAGQPWRPLTMLPEGAWNALFALVVPAATYATWAVTPSDQRRAVLVLLVALGLFSLALGVVQMATGQLYFFRLSNPGSPTGLFANRNHQAVYLALLIPMMATYASLARDARQARHRDFATLAVGLLLTPVLLVIGSRAGLIAGVVAALAATMLYRHPLRAAPRGKKEPLWAAGLAVGAAVLLLVAGTAILAKAEALTRLLETGGSSEVRAANWRTVVHIIPSYLPFGSGAGSFVPVFQIHEPMSQLKYTYFNHAHNEPLEIALTLGLPGIALLAVAAAAWLWASIRLWRTGRVRDRDILFGQLGSVVLLVVALASLVDYPTRTPSLAALTMLAALWMANGYQCLKESRPLPGGGVND